MEVEPESGFRPTVNDADLVTRVMPAFAEAVGASNVRIARQSMGAEDFALYDGIEALKKDGNLNPGHKVPICLFILGTISPARFDAARAKGERMPALHSSKYVPEAGPSIAIGVRAMTAAVTRLLPPAKPR